jgi:hypothetical protein
MKTELNNLKTAIKMKTIILAILNLINIAYSQSNINIITPEQFDNIKFNNVLLTDIKETHGNIENIYFLFPTFNSNQIEIESYGEDIGMPQRVFNFDNGMMIAFSWEIIGQDPELVRLESNSITINGTTLNLGDSIDLLSNNYQLTILDNGLNSIIIIKDGESCCPISIDLNSFNRIYKITYYVVP